MPRVNRDRGQGWERAVLAVAALSSAALLLAATSSFSDPELAGRRVMERLAAGVVAGVRAEWTRMLRDGPGGSAAREELAWRDDLALVLPLAAPSPAAARDPEGAESFALILSAAQAQELRAGEVAQAAELVREALALPGISRGQRALGLLRAVQLAGELGEVPAVEVAWSAAAAELAGEEAVGDTSVLLLAGLAASAHLAPDARRAACDLLCAKWLAGELALPEDPPRLAALRERLDEMGAGAHPGLAEWFLARRVRELRSELGGLPALAAGEARPLVSPRGLLVLRRGFDGTWSASRTALAACRAELEERVAAAELLPEGFALDLALDDDSLGGAVSDVVPLAGRDLGFVLRHDDPRGVVRSERRRAFLLRVALVLMAAFTAAAGFVTQRALRRERRLAGLKSTFVANVSHELRTPLAAILLMAENLADGRVCGDEAGRRYHAAIRREATRLRRLVDDVLDFSRLERGEPPRLQVEELRLEPWLAELEAELAQRAQADGRALRVERGELPASAELDGEALRRAVLNLVDNALKHGGEPVDVHVSSADGALSIGVRDHGAGVPAAGRERLFEPFARRTDAVGGGAPGTGLGLAIVRAIARAHGGDVCACDPQEGPGVLFRLDLPLATGGPS